MGTAVHTSSALLWQGTATIANRMTFCFHATSAGGSVSHVSNTSSSSIREPVEAGALPLFMENTAKITRVNSRLSMRH